MIRVKSIYARPAEEDGWRVLVDRFWPEGLKTAEVQFDDWLSDLGPSYDLQRFHFDPTNWEPYVEAYRQELLGSPEKRALLQALADQARNGRLTLLYGTRDRERNHAAVVKQILEEEYLNQTREG